MIAVYQQSPLPLHAAKIMGKRLVAGNLSDEPLSETALRAVEKIRTGEIQAARMITHRFPFAKAKEAFDFLWTSPESALGVLLIWK